jgi:phosphatidylglycerophosphate synthase
MLDYRQFPNHLTLLRLVLAAAFFVVLSMYRYPMGPHWVLWVSIVLFVAAALTDFFDGYLARKWQVESTFGRIMDPFCDKVLILGAFTFLAGPRFVDTTVATTAGTLLGNIMPGNMVTGVYPWMVVVILARELLVTGIRGEMEGQGVKFGAKTIGKWKMVLQSVSIPVVLGLVWFDPHIEGRAWMAWCISGLVYLTIAVTVLSGIPYMVSARRAMRRG